MKKEQKNKKYKENNDQDTLGIFLMRYSTELFIIIAWIIIAAIYTFYWNTISIVIWLATVMIVISNVKLILKDGRYNKRKNKRTL